MLSGPRTRPLAFALAFLFALACAQHVAAQDDFEDDAADPVKLFNKGQDAHAKKNYEQAIELYDEALKLRPDFPEVEFQKAGALVALKRTGDAAESLALWRRATELKGEDEALWVERGRAERASKDAASARRSFQRAL